MREGRFFIEGLGLLAQGMIFTPRERHIMNWLCSAAAESDATYFDQLQRAVPGSDLRRGIEELKDTFRSLGKAKVLEDYYDRAAKVQRDVPTD